MAATIRRKRWSSRISAPPRGCWRASWPRTSLEGRQTMTAADILVIGGGIAGASAAYELAAQAKVILLERETHCGYHATGRSAASFTENYGTPMVRRLAMAGRSFFETPPEGFAEHPLVRPRGMITIARADQIDALNEELARAQRFVPSMGRMDWEEALSLGPGRRLDYLAEAL